MFLDVDGVGGAPVTVVDKAVKKLNDLRAQANREAADSFESAYEVWAVFDADNYAIKDLAAAKKRAKDNGILVAFSNPCFEIWALLHFRDVGPLTNKEAQKALKPFMPKYNHAKGGVLDITLMKANYETAVRRAQRYLAERIKERVPEGNPSTGVHRLTQSILEK